MRMGLAASRVLLRRLREVLAEPISPQDRLDKIVELIAANMVAEVCSAYVSCAPTTSLSSTPPSASTPTRCTTPSCALAKASSA